MWTNMKLMERLSKEPKQLFGHVFTKGDLILYWERERQERYLHQACKLFNVAQRY